MIRIDCRGARKRSGMTQERWAQAVCLSVDRIRQLEYRQGQLPGWESAYLMAHYGGYLRIDGPQGPMALAPLSLVLHPDIHQLTVLEVEGQTSLFGTPVIAHIPSSVLWQSVPGHEQQGGQQQLTLV